MFSVQFVQPTRPKRRYGGLWWSPGGHPRPKFAGAPLTALDPDDLRYILRHARRDRLLAAAVEQELIRRIPRLRSRRAPARRA